MRIMSKKPTNLSLHTKVLEMADAIMEMRGFSSLSALSEELIRAEYERRFGAVIVQETTPAKNINSTRTSAEVDADVSKIIQQGPDKGKPVKRVSYGKKR